MTPCPPAKSLKCETLNLIKPPNSPLNVSPRNAAARQLQHARDGHREQEVQGNGLGAAAALAGAWAARPLDILVL